jgi:hypothetical protein
VVRRIKGARCRGLPQRRRRDPGRLCRNGLAASEPPARSVVEIAVLQDGVEIESYTMELGDCERLEAGLAGARRKP